MGRTIPTPIGGIRRRYTWDSDPRPTAFDAFAGIGGNSLGLQQAGFRVIGAVELDPVAVKSYLANHYKSTVWEQDLRELTGTSIMDELGLERGGLDLLAGCPPCQGFSRIRTKNGEPVDDDPRNDLVREFLRLARSMRPKTVVMENVPGLNRDERLEILMDGLQRAGYHTDHRLLDAADFGVPQRRKRLIVAASRMGSVALPEGNSEHITVRETLVDLPELNDGDKLHAGAPNRDPRIKRLIKRIPKDGGSRLDLGDEAQLDCHKKVDGFKDVYGRMSWDEVAPTITGGCINPSKGRFLHPEEDRAITLREAALLQSFPSRYTVSLRRGRYHAAAMIGNALPPKLIRAVGRRIIRHLEEHTPDENAD